MKQEVEKGGYGNKRWRNEKGTRGGEREDRKKVK